MTIWWHIRLNIALWLLKAAGKALKWLAAAVIAAAWPITLVAVTWFTAAWLTGWPPARLYRAARWSLPVLAVYLLTAGVQAGSWQAAARWPALGWARGWRDLAAGNPLTAFAVVAPVAVPAGLAVAGACWARRICGIETGLDGRTATRARRVRRTAVAPAGPPHADASPSPPPSRCSTRGARSS